MAEWDWSLRFFDHVEVSASDYAESIRTSPLDVQKLACNMLAVAAASLRRGGRLVVRDAPLTIEGLRGRVVAVEFWTFG